MVSYYPRDYQFRGDITPAADAENGKKQSFILKVSSAFKSERIFSKRTGRYMEIQKFVASDDTGSINIVFFNSPFLSATFTREKVFRFYGEVKSDGLFSTLTCPLYEVAENSALLNDYIPVYALTSGLTPKILSAALKEAIEVFKNKCFDKLDEDIKDEYELCSLYDALRGIHFPKNKETLEKSRKRLVFEELYDFQCKLLNLYNHDKVKNAKRLIYPDMKQFTAVLPFTLTYEQKRAIQDLLVDMTGVTGPCTTLSEERITAARRLVQGDVGSGKTMVAAAGMFVTARNKTQSALMAPTSILAHQHYETLKIIFDKLNISCALLHGGLKKSEKEAIYKSLKSGEIDAVIGTHALLSQGVEFKNLSLVITDEQHRFGVEQRKSLQMSKNDFDSFVPHMLAMSATPIPRTLSMVLYGDMDISIIDKLPPGRLPVKTLSCGEELRPKVYNFIRKQISEGRQCYIICPLVEEKIKEDDFIPYILYSSEDEKKSVSKYTQKLKDEIFPDIAIDYIHGKMKQSEKDKKMDEFKNGTTRILVSTTVIEVGVNVPNATVILIENAESYGLSQLHQLRGRVCRGNKQAYCILMSPKYSQSDSESYFSKRMKIMTESEDGFYISKKDLELRGPGEFFGKRQHGELKFKIADIALDSEIIMQSRAAAMKKIGK